MTGLLPFIGVAAGLLIVLAFAARRRRRENSLWEQPPALPERALMYQILSLEDFAFIKSLHSAELRRLFLRERRRLALDWMNEMLREAQRLMLLHGRLARHSPDLSIMHELQVAFEYSVFLGVYGVAFGLVWLFGPYRLRGMLGSVRSLAGAFELLGRRITGGDATLQGSVAAV